MRRAWLTATLFAAALLAGCAHENKAPPPSDDNKEEAAAENCRRASSRTPGRPRTRRATRRRCWLTTRVLRIASAGNGAGAGRRRRRRRSCSRRRSGRPPRTLPAVESVPAVKITPGANARKCGPGRLRVDRQAHRLVAVQVRLAGAHARRSVDLVKVGAPVGLGATRSPSLKAFWPILWSKMMRVVIGLPPMHSR